MPRYTSLQPDNPGGVGGLQVARSLGLLNTGTTNPKTKAGAVYGWHIRNNNAATIFVKLYDKSASPSSSDTPLLTLAISAGTTVSASHPHGIPFASGIGWRACTGVADNDDTAPSANDVVANLFYA